MTPLRRPLPRLRPAARILGVHLEGPFISPLRAGAHNKDWIIDPSPGAIAELLDAGDGILKIVTLAPERPGALAAIGLLAEAGVRVSVGHSDATAAPGRGGGGRGRPDGDAPVQRAAGMHHREPAWSARRSADPR